MKHGKLLLAVVGAATVLFGALVPSASAGRLRFTDNRFRAVWATFNYSGAPGTIECEVTFEGTFHVLTVEKINLSLMGFITAAAVRNPCRRGEATILRETLPWHIKYRSFAGTLPDISSIRTDVIGLSMRIREPTFGIQCLLRTTPEAPGILTLNRSIVTSIIESLAISGTEMCGSFGVSASGTSATPENRAGARISVTLI